MAGGDDERGPGAAWSRRLSRAETAFWYGLAGVGYVGLATFHKFLLNWVLGPVWLVAVVWCGPALVDRVTQRRPPREASAP